jgi:hypothetical protein
MSSVVINEFEVVPQAPATAQRDVATAQTAPEAPPPEFEREIERALGRKRVRAKRLEAD